MSPTGSSAVDTQDVDAGDVDSGDVETRLLTLHGLHVALRIEGEGDPLLLINGMTRPLRSWEHFTRELSGRRIVSFDAPGVGASPTPVLPVSIPGLAALAVAVMDAAGLEDADVLGFSHGGAVAQQLAVDAPERVRRLVLVSTSCGVGATPGSGQASLRGLATPGGADSWPRADVVGVLWHSLAFSGWSSIPFLGAIKAPTLVVCGTHDRIVPPANSRVLAARITGASLAMLPGGHDLQRPDPARALADVVERFLPHARATEPATTDGTEVARAEGARAEGARAEGALQHLPGVTRPTMAAVLPSKCKTAPSKVRIAPVVLRRAGS